MNTGNNKYGFSILILAFIVFTSCQRTVQIYEAIDISGFYDSSHHWYDINDEKRMIIPLADQQRYKPEQIVEIADNILLFQKNNGGWPKNYDMLAILTEEQKRVVENAKDEINTTFDNGASHSQIEYLAKVFEKTNDEKYRNACLKGLDYVISAQYENGGWPQFYPDTSGYRKYITFNDGAMMGVVKLLADIVNKQPHFSFVDSARTEKIKSSYDNAVHCILNCQIMEDGKYTAWCQQHDNVTLAPQSARTFEPACICNGESAEIVDFLMDIENPDKQIIDGIQNAIKWFDESKIKGIRLDSVTTPPDTFQYHIAAFDKIIVEDNLAPAIWTRYYQLGDHVPMFCNRDGKPVYSMAEVDKERRTGYGWYTYAPQAVLDKYVEWQKKYSPEMNVLESNLIKTN